MNKKTSSYEFLGLLVITGAICLSVAAAQTNTQTKASSTMRGTTIQQHRQAAANAVINKGKPRPHMLVMSPLGVKSQAIVGPAGLTLGQIYFGTSPNYANSPLPGVTVDSSGVVRGFTSGTGIRKFVDTLPGLNTLNDLGQQIPVAVPDQVTFPGSDYYEISLSEYSTKMHTDLPATKLRGYVQVNKGTDATGTNTIAPAGIQYLGPLIIAQTGKPVRVKFTNNLRIGAGGNLFIPVDKTVMGAGMGPDGTAYSENRGTIHLHGGNTPWISDGTPNQWTAPAGEVTSFPRGVSTQFVPDMFFDASGNVVKVPACGAGITTNCWPNAIPAGLKNDPGPGSMTFYYTNQQSARLMFYHDHSYGITRLNVYAGEAAGYLLQDTYEAGMVASGAIPSLQIPLIIQDKTFVPANPASAPVYSVAVLAGGQDYSLATTVGFVNGACATVPTAIPVIGTATDGFGGVFPNAITGITLTNGGDCSTAPDVVISDTLGSGAAAFASRATLAQQDPTWDTALWGGGAPDTINGSGSLWFPHTYMTNQWPGNPDGSSMNPMGRWDYGMWFWPPMTLSKNGGLDGGLVHGTVPCSPGSTMVCPGFPNTLNPDATTGSVASLTPESFMDTPLVNGTAYPTLTVPAGAVRFRILNAGNDRSINLSLFQADPSVTTIDNRKNTEVKMVPATPTPNWPIYWPTDGRDGGVPDPLTAGPSMIQIGNEAGFIPNPVVIPPTPVGYEYARRSITVTNVSFKSLYMGPAERADVIVDFSAYAGQTLILYNDAPAPTPAFDPRYDYYTGDPDMTGMGGAPSTLAGFGPNTRTIMQIVVQGTGSPSNLPLLKTALPTAFKASQPAPIVPEAAYSSTYGQAFPNTFLKLQDYQTSFTPIGATAPITMTLLDKTIQELFELNYGRMNATLGTELPLTNFTTQTTIPLGYIDPPTELLTDSKAVSGQPVGTLGDGTQIWKITHNGVDTHAIHFHLFNVQLLNRIGWDGTNRPPDPNELGWKETVRMNPLEIEFVALRPMSQNLPWPIPDSIRPLDVTMMPEMKDPGMFLLTGTGGNADQINHVTNFGQEYVWHCHLLGHEENDMMRPMVLQVAPGTPNPLSAIANKTGGVVLTFTDNSANEVNFQLQKDGFATFPSPTVITVPANVPNSSFGLPITYIDKIGAVAKVYYRVRAVADLPGFSTLLTPTPEYSGWSNTVLFAAAPIAGITPTTLAFGNQTIGTRSAIQSVTLSNTGTATLGNIIAKLGDLINYTVSNNCGVSLAPGVTCTIDVAFAPTVTGSHPTTLSANPTLTVMITGSALTAIVSPAALFFGNQTVNTTSAGRTITLTNLGTTPFNINSITNSNTTDYTFTTTCGATLRAGRTCNVVVRFAPQSSGVLTGTISISESADPLPLTASLTGTGALPVLNVSATFLAFGTITNRTTSPYQGVTVSNTGNAPLQINAINLVGNAGQFNQNNNCPASLAAGANCTVNVRFSPSQRGAKTATLNVNVATPAASQQVALTGIAQ